MVAIPYQRTKEYLEALGWHEARGEHWNQWAHIRQDTFGLADHMFIRHDFKGTWYVNSCADNGEVQAHVDKYLNGWNHPKRGHMPPNPHLPVMLCGNRFSIFGWGKRGAAGERKVWTLRVMEAYLDGAEPKFREVAQAEGDL